MGLLCRDRVVVAPDTPGFGASDAPASPPSIADYADAMSEFVETLDLQQPLDVIGYHTGSLVGTELSCTRPEMVRRLVLISTPLFDDAQLQVIRRAYRPDPIDEAGTHLTNRWRLLREWGDSAQTLENTMRDFVEHVRGGTKAEWGVEAAFNYRIQDRLPLVQQPVLVLNPEDDLFEVTPSCRPLLRNGAIHDLPNRSHGMLDAHTEQFDALLRRFLDAERFVPSEFD